MNEPVPMRPDDATAFANHTPETNGVKRGSAPGQQEETSQGKPVAAFRFRLGATTLALSLRVVKAVAEQRTVCAVPYRHNAAFLGLVTYAGDVLPCCSLAKILGIATEVTVPAQKARLIILEERPGERWAFPADAVLGVASGRLEARNVPAEVSTEWAEHILVDESGAAVNLLKPETLFARFAQAVG